VCGTTRAEDALVIAKLDQLEAFVRWSRGTDTFGIDKPPPPNESARQLHWQAQPPSTTGHSDSPSQADSAACPLASIGKDTIADINVQR
jgi:hypothetical protein